MDLEKKTRVNLWNQFKNGSFTDCTLIAECQVVSAHRNVLAASIPWWNKVDNFFTLDKLVISFDGMSKEELDLILELSYLGEVFVPDDKVEKFKEVLQFFDMPISAITQSQPTRIKPQMEPQLSFYKFTTSQEQQRASIVDLAEIARANKKTKKLRGKSLFIDKTPTAPKQQEAAKANLNQSYIMEKASNCLDRAKPKTNPKILQPSNKIGAPVGTEMVKYVNLIERKCENLVLEAPKMIVTFPVDKFTDKTNENAQVLQALKVTNKKKLQETKIKPGTEICPGIKEVLQFFDMPKKLRGKSLFTDKTSTARQPLVAARVDSAEIARANQKSIKLRGKSLFIDKTSTDQRHQEAAKANPNQISVVEKASKCLDRVKPQTNLKILQPFNQIAAPVGTEMAKNVNLIEQKSEYIVLEAPKMIVTFPVDKFTDKSKENSQVLQALKVPNKKKLQETKVKPGTESCPICGVNVKSQMMESHVYRAHLKIRRRASIF